MKLKPKRGWAVEINSREKLKGFPALSCTTEGDLPAVFEYRSNAVMHKDRKRSEGWKARVVRVLYAEPVVL